MVFSINRLIILFLVIISSACETSIQYQKNIALVADEKILDLSTNQTISLEELIKRLSTADYILLGEEHDQVRHHQIAYFLLYRLQPSLKSVVFEMLNVAQQPAIQQIKKSETGLSDAEIKQRLAWDKWDWSQYSALVKAALLTPLNTFAANLTTEEINILMNGAEPLKGQISIQKQVRQQIAALINSHHQIEDSILPKMVDVQQFKDRRFAEKLTKAPFPALLIAGNNHVQKNIGVPLHLKDYQSKQNTIVLMLKSKSVETINAEQSDYLWLTK